jgi:C-terminal processing protease CtpA/Prc
VTTDVIEKMLSLLCANYVLPDNAERIAAVIRERAAAGDYADLDEELLAKRLTEHLVDLSGDIHLRVRVIAAEPAATAGEGDEEAQYAWGLRKHNFGIARVERLRGNIGYIDIRSIDDPAYAGPAIAAAMELIAHTEALILDLRKGVGGCPEGTALWHSYLFPDGEVFLDTVEDRGTGLTKQYWTFTYVPGSRYLHRPVYLLTSKRTFSGTEEFCYILKVQGRATLIGETTRGGAHMPVDRKITPTLELNVPDARFVNPVTGTNWEGVGVQPDVSVPADEALAVGYRTALEHVLATQNDEEVLAEAREALLEPWLTQTP